MNLIFEKLDDIFCKKKTNEMLLVLTNRINCKFEETKITGRISLEFISS